VKQELRKDKNEQFFIVTNDQNGQPYYRPLRLLSNTAVTSIVMTTQNEAQAKQAASNVDGNARAMRYPNGIDDGAVSDMRQEICD